MPVKSFRPTTPTRRFQTVVSREEITKQKPEKSLVKGKPATGGRSSTGRISSRFRGGGHKKAYREIDCRDKHGLSQWWRLSSTIPIAALVLLCCIMWMARSATFWPRWARSWAQSDDRDRMRTFWLAIRCCSRIFWPARWCTTLN